MAIKITKKMITKAAKSANKDQRETMFVSIINDLLPWAARYAHGRNTYAPGMVRKAVDMMKKMCPGWEPKKDETIEAPEERMSFQLEEDYLHDIFNPQQKDLEKEFLRESNAIEGVYSEGSFCQAMVAWDYLKSIQILTPSVVLKTHKILMLHQPLRSNEKGYFRRCLVWVGGYEAMPHQRIEASILEWCEAMNRGNRAKIMTDETFSKSLHIQYEKIHPFIDGNGRTGRMFMNWQRLKVGLPILVIKENERQAYYEWFK